MPSPRAGRKAHEPPQLGALTGSGFGSIGRRPTRPADERDPGMISPLIEVGEAPPAPGGEPDRLAAALEGGAVVLFPSLPFPLDAFEHRFVERPYADGAAKNVSIRGDAGTIKGAGGTPAEQEALRKLLLRYRAFALDLIDRFFPAYAGKLTAAGTSYRPFDVDTRKLSWRRDDTRLHVDAFPSNPLGDKRILRVFRNVDAAGRSRVWRVGEDFASMADRFLPRVPRYSPLSARLLAAIGITKARRSEYDHVMLHLHDELKKDLDYQASAPQQQIAFSPGQTWVTFSDLVMHGAMGGRYMLEQTLYLPVASQLDPGKSPQRILERKLGRSIQ